MQKLSLTLLVVFFFSCKNDVNRISDDLNTETINAGPKSLTFALLPSVVKNALNVKGQGAKGDGVTGEPKSITSALIYALTTGITSIYFPDGSYIIGKLGNKCGIIKLVNSGVSFKNYLEMAKANPITGTPLDGTLSAQAGSSTPISSAMPVRPLKMYVGS